jgi:hypothetical protein
MENFPLMIAAMAAVAFTGCSTEYQAIESAKPIVGQGQWGARKVVDGVDIWTDGAPPRKFVVIGVIKDQRPPGPGPMAQYYHDVAKQVRQHGGDAAIEMNSRSEQIGAVATTTTNTASTGNFSGYGYGNLVSGNVSGNSTTTGTTVAMPLTKHLGTFAVVKYL